MKKKTIRIAVTIDEYGDYYAAGFPGTDNDMMQTALDCGEKLHGQERRCIVVAEVPLPTTVEVKGKVEDA